MRSTPRLAVVALLCAGSLACVHSRPARVLLIGIDGADPGILERLMGEGRLPNFARLKSMGAFGPLRSREPLLSPVVWTTIATGRKAQDHGILDFVEISADGTPTPIGSSKRRVPALWNIVDHAGKSAGFIGWYASFPAEQVRGFVVSDHLGFHQVKSSSVGAGATFPEGLAEELRLRFGVVSPQSEATRTRFVETRQELSSDGEARLARLAEIHATSELYRQATLYLHEQRPTDLLAVYFELIDACGHLFMEDASPQRTGIAPEDFAAFSKTTDRCYEYQDEILGDLVKMAGPSTVTIVVSDHGFKSGASRPMTSGRADTGLAPLWHKPNGVILIAGPGVRPGTTISGATILDVAPTVLSLLRIPSSRELPGVPLRQAFEAGTWPEMRPVDRFAIAAPRGGPAEHDDSAVERIEQLRALGYLGKTATLGHDDEGRTVTSFLNEGISLVVDGDETGALRAYARALDLDPGNVNARVFTARIETHRGEMEKAKKLLDQALALDPRSIGVLLQRAAWAVETRRWEEAAADLKAAGALDDRLPHFHLLRARVAQHAGHSSEALAELREAEALADAEPFLGETLRLQAQVAAELGRADEAEEALQQAQSIDPTPVPASLVGDVAMARGDWTRAAGLYREALAAHPTDSVLERRLGQALAGSNDDASAEAALKRALEKARTDEEREGSLGDLALLYQKMGREPQARDVLLKGVSSLPRSAGLFGMLGAAWGRAGQLDKAIAAYQRSVALGPTPLACKTLAALLLGERKDKAAATALWKQSLALDPDQPDVREFLGLKTTH
jgi:predicted AlkP superfamily phosphohydrolase/phosphomutase/tetratricopeptide (TPR) repeat protein